MCVEHEIEERLRWITKVASSRKERRARVTPRGSCGRCAARCRLRRRREVAFGREPRNVTLKRRSERCEQEPGFPAIG